MQSTSGDGGGECRLMWQKMKQEKTQNSVTLQTVSPSKTVTGAIRGEKVLLP